MGQGHLKKSNIKYIQKALAGTQPPRWALGWCLPVPGGLNPLESRSWGNPHPEGIWPGWEHPAAGPRSRGDAIGW